MSKVGEIFGIIESNKSCKEVKILLRTLGCFFFELGMKFYLAFICLGLISLALTAGAYWWLNHGLAMGRSQVTETGLFDAINTPFADAISAILPYLYTFDVVWFALVVVLILGWIAVRK